MGDGVTIIADGHVVYPAVDGILCRQRKESYRGFRVCVGRSRFGFHVVCIHKQKGRVAITLASNAVITGLGSRQLRPCRDGRMRFAVRLGQFGEPEPCPGHFGKADPRLRVRTSLRYLRAVRSM